METFKPTQRRVEWNQWSACGKASIAQQAKSGGVLIHWPSDWTTPCAVHFTQYSRGCKCVEHHSWFLLLFDFFLWETWGPPPTLTPNSDPHCTGKDRCEKMTKAPVRQSDTKREVCYAAHRNSRRRFVSNPSRRSKLLCDLSADWFTFRRPPMQTSHLFFKDGCKWEKPQWLTLRKVQNEEFLQWRVCDADQSDAKVSMKLFAISALEGEEKGHRWAPPRFCFSLSLLFYVKAPGHSSTRPHQTLQPPCLHILLGDTERKIQSSTDCCFTFPPLFKYHWRHGWNKTYWGSRIGEGKKKKDTALSTWPCCLNYLPLAAALKGATSVLYVPESWTATSQGCFSPLVFNALLVRPLIPPLVSLFHNTRKKYNLTCNFFVEGANTIFFFLLCFVFSKANFIDKGWVHSTWKFVCHSRCADNTIPRLLSLSLLSCVCIIGADQGKSYLFFLWMKIQRWRTLTAR